MKEIILKFTNERKENKRRKIIFKEEKRKNETKQ